MQAVSWSFPAQAAGVQNAAIHSEGIRKAAVDVAVISHFRSFSIAYRSWRFISWYARDGIRDGTASTLQMVALEVFPQCPHHPGSGRFCRARGRVMIRLRNENGGSLKQAPTRYSSTAGSRANGPAAMAKAGDLQGLIRAPSGLENGLRRQAGVAHYCVSV